MSCTRRSHLALGFLLMASAGTAVCRYTVRDIGFVDLSGPDYALRLHATEEAQFAASEALAVFDPEGESNLRFERLPSEDATRWSIISDSRPEFFLEGLDVDADDLGAASAFERVLGSQVLTGLSDETLATFAFAIIVEGTDDEANGALHELVAEARERLADVEDQLPRQIDWPLRTVVVESGERHAEDVLLWALGLTPDDLGADQNALALVYGRGKLAGPVLSGVELQLREVLEQLVLIGESCECDTNRAWTDEPRVPLRWTDAQRAAAVASLGFEPDSPMVMGEVARILARGSRNLEQRKSQGIDSLLFGYQETSLALNTLAAARGGSSNPIATPIRERSSGLRVMDAGEGDWAFADDGQDGELQGPPPAPGQDAAEDGGGPTPSVALGPILMLGGTLLILLFALGAAFILGRGKEE